MSHPLCFWWSSLIAALRQQSAAAADERLRLLGECLAGVAAVKALRAERDIEARIQAARAREMRALHKIAMLKALNYSLQYITTPIAALLLFTTAYVLNPDVDGGLNDAAIFYSLSLLALPEFYLLRMFVRSWQRLQEARTSAARIDDILSAPEPPPSASEKWLAAAAAAAGGGGKGAPAAGTGPLPLRGTVELRGGRYGWPGGALSAAAAGDAAPGHGGARSDAGTDAAASDGGGGGDDEAGGSYGIDMQPAFSFVSKASSDLTPLGDGGSSLSGGQPEPSRGPAALPRRRAEARSLHTVTPATNEI
ncbi:hypothetical protein MNEG_15873 [Monoraphidium neglectum]|uniref:ABC transmembrane type-1 domain-containing protein n=1 Tax=Monoraphidium neglectum TaxID=145388 RepID=A0A0D2M9N5_9CHLO|nr:hypothetical protein MNEG_15873 [Monoraphidium neglectum]KIY92090.1 hypothetical protein MNEG_15873 [Monoraphidium neglectum]|eukprot:XP_013891110.1 hypothetical protein MNEG_15873 [Monoraphidium neglectum]